MIYWHWKSWLRKHRLVSFRPSQVAILRSSPNFFFGVTDRRERLTSCLGLVILWSNCIKDEWLSRNVIAYWYFQTGTCMEHVFLQSQCVKTCFMTGGECLFLKVNTMYSYYCRRRKKRGNSVCAKQYVVGANCHLIEDTLLPKTFAPLGLLIIKMNYF